MFRLLIVEDEPKLLRHIRQGLQEEGYDIVTAADGEEGFRLATAEPVDLVLLDLMLPKRDGLDVLGELRRQGFQQPVLVLTARDAVGDRVTGLECGADDYLVKPFAFAELVARIRALLRRKPTSQPMLLRAGDLEMNLLTRRVTRGRVELELSAREYELLEYFLRHVNETLARESIARGIWKEAGPVETNIIDVYVSYLRKKIERPDLPPLIHTVRGVGYCLRDEAWRQSASAGD